MDREDRLVGVRHPFAHGAEHLPVFGRRRVADRIGQVYRGGARLDRPFDTPAEVVDRCTGRVHGRPFHVLHEVAGLSHSLEDDLQHFVLGLAHLVRQMDRRGRHEGMDAPALGMAHRLAGPGDVRGDGPGQPRNRRALCAAGDLGHSLEVAVGGDGEPRLDDVHTHRIEQLRHRELLVEGHGGAGALLAVAQRGVEDQDPVAGAGCVGCRAHGVAFLNPARAPPGARPEAGGARDGLVSRNLP